MAKRKTFDVSELVSVTNNILKNSDSDCIDRRIGAMSVLETVLHSTGNYKGFRYLLEDECKGKPGVNYIDGMPHPNPTSRFTGTDSTRVQYY